MTIPPIERCDYSTMSALHAAVAAVTRCAIAAVLQGFVRVASVTDAQIAARAVREKARAVSSWTMVKN